MAAQLCDCVGGRCGSALGRGPQWRNQSGCAASFGIERRLFYSAFAQLSATQYKAKHPVANFAMGRFSFLLRHLQPRGLPAY
jgi:hypothetical protein